MANFLQLNSIALTTKIRMNWTSLTPVSTFVLACFVGAAVLGCHRPPKEPETTITTTEACQPGKRTASVLRLGATPFGSSNVMLSGYQGIADYVEQVTGIPVEVVAIDDYADMTAQLKSQQLEIALLPPLEYLAAKELMPCLQPSLTTVQDGQTKYTGYLVVRCDSGIDDVRQLNGGKLGLVSKNSASGDLFPRVRLLADGINADRDMEQVVYFGSHLAVIQAVLSKTIDVGATFDAGLEIARREGLDTKALSILAITGRIPLEAVVIHPDLDPAIIDKVERAFATLNNSTHTGRTALGPLGTVVGYARSNDAFYDTVRETLKAYQQLSGGAQ